jgi:hypothetical protein
MAVHVYEVHIKTPSSKSWTIHSEHTSNTAALTAANKLKKASLTSDTIRGTQIKVLKIEHRPVSETVLSTPEPVSKTPTKKEKPKAKTNLEKMTDPKAKPHARTPRDTSKTIKLPRKRTTAPTLPGTTASNPKRGK